MGGADADGGCCTLKRGSGIFILVLSIISLVGSIICAVIASFTHMPLYAVFGWIHVLLLISLISAGSAYVCCRVCGSKVTRGLHRPPTYLTWIPDLAPGGGRPPGPRCKTRGCLECK